MALGQQPKKPIATTGEPPNAPVQRGRGFLHEVMVELRKTTWPTLPEAWRLTTVVLGVIVAMAIYVGIIDAALSFLTNRFHLIK
jgi:preprotein translocase subunit SecE